jgi:uracil-DNA glycosylase family 4
MNGLPYKGRATELAALQEEIIHCRRCPRLVEHREKIAAVKRRAYMDWTYWGKPVPSFGDPAAELLIVGLAPAAHGANRTGRMFTGDRSGDLLYKVLHATGFASQPLSCYRNDGLKLEGAYITAIVRCAPPGNKPLREEIENCRIFLEREIDLLEDVKVVVTLGRLAHNVYKTSLKRTGLIETSAALSFAHNLAHRIESRRLWLLSSYHPSQQNTSTGRLTEKMFQAVFVKAKQLLDTMRLGPGA